MASAPQMDLKVLLFIGLTAVLANGRLSVIVIHNNMVKSDCKIRNKETM